MFGYTIVNDITARDLQQRHKQFFIGKSLDTSCPIGPWIVHHTAIRKPEQPRNYYKGKWGNSARLKYKAFYFPCRRNHFRSITRNDARAG